MKNRLFWSILFIFISTQMHAELTQSVTPPPQKPTQTNTPNNFPSIHPAPPATPAINCDYKIPAETKKIDQSLVTTWAKQAVTQAFDFDVNHLDTQLQKLQACFTEQGWTGFNNALQKSGNLEAIKSHKLTVSSKVEEPILMLEAKDNQWKLSLPLQVIYQSDKEKVSQLLSVDLIVSRQITGNLGISQLIAAPRGTVTQEKSANTPNNGSTSNSATMPGAAQESPATGTP